MLGSPKGTSRLIHKHVGRGGFCGYPFPCFQLLDLLLVVALLQVAIPAEHLTVIGCRVSAFRPGFDVIGLHFLEFKHVSADSALVALLFVGCLCVSNVKGSDA